MAAPEGEAARSTPAIHQGPRFPGSLVWAHIKQAMAERAARRQKPRPAIITRLEQVFIAYEGMLLVGVLAFFFVKFSADTYLQDRQAEMQKKRQLSEQYESQTRTHLTHVKQIQSSAAFWSELLTRSESRVQQWQLQFQVDQLREQVHQLQRQRDMATQHTTTERSWGSAAWRRWFGPLWRSHQQPSPSPSHTPATAPTMQHTDATAHASTTQTHSRGHAPTQQADTTARSHTADRTSSNGSQSLLSAQHTAGASNQSSEGRYTSGSVQTAGEQEMGPSDAGGVGVWGRVVRWWAGRDIGEPAVGTTHSVVSGAADQASVDTQHGMSVQHTGDSTQQGQLCSHTTTTQSPHTEPHGVLETHGHAAGHTSHSAATQTDSDSVGHVSQFTHHGPSGSHPGSSVDSSVDHGVSHVPPRSPQHHGRVSQQEGVGPGATLSLPAVHDQLLHSADSAQHWSQWHETCRQQLHLLEAIHDHEMRILFESEMQYNRWRKYTARDLMFESGGLVPLSDRFVRWWFDLPNPNTSSSLPPPPVESPTEPSTAPTSSSPPASPSDTTHNSPDGSLTSSSTQDSHASSIQAVGSQHAVASSTQTLESQRQGEGGQTQALDSQAQAQVASSHTHAAQSATSATPGVVVRVRVWRPLWEAMNHEDELIDAQSTWDAIWQSIVGGESLID